MNVTDLEDLVNSDTLSRLIVVEGIGIVDIKVPYRKVKFIEDWLYHNCPAYIKYIVGAIGSPCKKGFFYSLVLPSSPRIMSIQGYYK